MAASDKFFARTACFDSNWRLRRGALSVPLKKVRREVDDGRSDCLVLMGSLCTANVTEN
jgi:hypothetical protein